MSIQYLRVELWFVECPFGTFYSKLATPAVSRRHVKMSVISGLNKADFKTASDGLLELSDERLRSIMRTEPISNVYHVEQTPFARYVGLQRSGLIVYTYLYFDEIFN